MIEEQTEVTYENVRQTEMEGENPEMTNEDELERLISQMKTMTCTHFDPEKKGCINNKETTFFTKNTKEAETFFECPLTSCSKIGYMCRFCSENCHSHGKDNMAVKQVFKNKIKCGCARHDHKVNVNFDSQSRVRETKDSCQEFTSFLKDLNVRVWARPKDKSCRRSTKNLIQHEEYKGGEDGNFFSKSGSNTHSAKSAHEHVHTYTNYLCLYCYEKCKEKKDSYEIVSVDEDKFKIIKCSCELSSKHDVTIMKKEVIKCIAKDEENPAYSTKFDKQCLMGKILTGSHYFTDNKFDETNHKIKQGNQWEENFDNSYLQVLELIETFTNLNKKVVYNISADENYKFKSFDIDFLKNLTDFIVDKGPTKYLEISCGILPKLMYYYRYFHIYPKIHIKNIKLIHKHRENISPIHRYFLKDKLDVMFNSLCEQTKGAQAQEILKNEFKANFNSFFENVFKIIKILLKDGIDTGNFAELIRQFFQIVELLLCYQLEIDYFSQLVVKILGILKFYKTNPTVFVTEEKFDDNIELDSQRLNLQRNTTVKEIEKKDENSKIPIIKLNRDIRKLMPLLVICLNDIQFEKEVFPKGNSYKRKKDSGFIFEDNEIQKNILQIYFYAEKNNFNGLYIYQTMLEKNDSYVDNIRYMLNAKDNFFNDDFEKVYMNDFDEKSFFNRHGYERTENIPDPRMNVYEDLKKDYFIGRKNVTEFLQDLSKHVDRYLKQEIKSCLNLTSKDEKFMKQLYLVKKGFLEMALDVFRLAIGNDYYTKDDSLAKNTYDIVITCLKNVLGALTEGNAFLSTIFFSPKVINLFFCPENKKYFFEIVKFYLNLLESIDESQVKINVKYILEKITHKTKDNQPRFTANRKSTKEINMTKQLSKEGNVPVVSYDIITIQDIRHEFSGIEGDKAGLSNEKLALIFKMYYKLLCVSTENTEVYINDLMVSVALNIITDDDVKAKMNEYEIKVKEGKKVDVHLETLTLKIYEILNKISTNYFYLINDKIDSAQLERLLKHFDTLNPGSRMIINKLYLRNKMKLPFRVDGSFMKTFYQFLQNGDNPLVIGKKLLETGLDNLENCGQVGNVGNYNSNFNTSRGSSSKGFGEFIKKPTQQDIVYENTYDELKLVKKILKNFKTKMIKKFEKDYFKNNPNSLLDFFEQVVLKTSLYTLYKIIYFNSTIDNTHKYYIYAIVYLFLDSLLYVLRLILERPKTDFESYTIIFKRHFRFTDSKKDDVRLLIERLYQEVETKIKDIEMGTYDYFDHMKFLELFNQFASSFQCFEKQNKQKYVKHTSKYNKYSSAFYKKINQFYANYKDKKGVHDTNLLIKIIKNNTDNTNSELFQDLKAKIVDDLIKKFLTYGSKIKHDRSNYLEQIISSGIEEIFPIVKKIVSVDPGLYQKYLIRSENKVTKGFAGMNNSETKTPKELIEDMVSEKIPYMMQFVLIEFSKNNIVSDIPYLSIFKDMLQFLEYISEKNDLTEFIAQTEIKLTPKSQEHNPRNNKQIVICKFEDILMTFLALIIENLRYYDSKKQMLKYLNPLLNQQKDQVLFENKHSHGGIETKETFFNVFIEKIFHLMSKLVRESKKQLYKEPIQDGSLSSSRYSYPFGFNYVKQISIELLKNNEMNSTFMMYIYHYVLFLDVISFEYEIDCDLKIKEVQNVMIGCFEKLLRYAEEKEKGKKEESSTVIKPINDNSAYDLLHKIREDKEIMENYQFVILSKLYIFINNIAQLSTPASQKYKKFLEDIRKYKQELLQNNSSSNKREEKTKLCLWSIYIIFEELMRSVEIVYVKNAKKEKGNIEDLEADGGANDEEENNSPAPIQIFYILHHDGLKIPRDSTIKNFFAICRYSSGLNKKLFFLINYYNYLNTLIKIIQKYSKDKFKYRLLNLIPKDANLEYYSAIFTVLTNISVMLSIYYNNPLDPLNRTLVDPFYFYTVLIALIHLIFLAFCIAIISYQEWVTYDFFTSQNGKELKKQEEDSSAELDFFRDFSNDKIYPLIWNFVFGFFALFNFPFLFSLQMFSLFLLFGTMKAAIHSVRSKYDKFLAAALLIFILIIFYALVSVIFYQDKFFNEDLNENVCDSVFKCVLSLLANGVKSGAGLGFSITSRNDPSYWSEFIFEWIFYFTIILVMLNIVNGIIVDTFQSMRQQNEINDKKRDDLCYVCSISRSKFEAHGIFFKKHCLEEHNVFNYMQYIIKIKNSEESSLNSAELMVRNKLKDSRIDFFPIKQSRRLKN